MPKLLSDYLFESCLVLAFLLTGLARLLAIKFKVFDVPNARSSHTQIVPRGGGLGIVATVFIALGIVVSSPSEGLGSEWLKVGLGGLLVAAAGFIDDVRSLSAAKRALVHIVSSGLLVWAVFPPSSMAFGWFAFAGLVVLAAWFINLYNFMDGTDGLAGSVGAFVSFSVFALFAAQGTDGSFLAKALCGSCVGFLIWNVPPARIFMGDVGSGFLGYAFAGLALILARELPHAFVVVPILLGAFIADTGVTLARRVLRGDKWYEAHRSHAYQRLARRYNHRMVMLTYSGVTLLFLAPMAWIASRASQGTSLMVLAAAWLPLILAAALLGAGQEERQPI